MAHEINISKDILKRLLDTQQILMTNDLKYENKFKNVFLFVNVLIRILHL